MASSFNKTRMDSNNTLETPTSSQKWWASGLMGMLFIIFSSTAMYDLTGGIIRRPTYYGDGPTILGLFIHGLLFTLAVRIILG